MSQRSDRSEKEPGSTMSTVEDPVVNARAEQLSMQGLNLPPPTSGRYGFFGLWATQPPICGVVGC